MDSSAVGRFADEGILELGHPVLEEPVGSFAMPELAELEDLAAVEGQLANLQQLCLVDERKVLAELIAIWELAVLEVRE